MDQTTTLHEALKSHEQKLKSSVNSRNLEQFKRSLDALASDVRGVLRVNNPIISYQQWNTEALPVLRAIEDVIKQNENYVLGDGDIGFQGSCFSLVILGVDYSKLGDPESIAYLHSEIKRRMGTEYGPILDLVSQLPKLKGERHVHLRPCIHSGTPKHLNWGSDYFVLPLVPEKNLGKIIAAGYCYGL